MKPTFCVYLDRCFRHHQERLDIETITVSKVQRSSEEKEGWNFGSPARWGWEDEQRVWYLEYKSSDNFIKRRLGLSTSPVSRLTYGEVPPGYEEGMRAKPLEPGELYSVWVNTYNYPGDAKPLRFIIRLDGTGSPEQLYYLNGLSRSDSLSERDDLKLY